MIGEYIVSGFLTICLIIAGYQAYKAYKIDKSKKHKKAH